VLFLILQVVSPSYYGDVWQSPLLMPVFLIFGGLALLGDFIMSQMVSFDF
jgi:tight adherence protein B